jgi:RNA polymerase sigma-70 factor, ECF subfamily
MPETKQNEFMRAYQRCHEPFLRYCSAVAYGKMDAQDLVQDVLLSAFHHFERIEQPEDLLHYLIRAARNRAISVWRVQRRNADLCDKQMARFRDRGASAEQLVDVQLLYSALDKLPSEHRDALVLFEVSGLSMAEIAAIQQCSEGAVKTRVSRARATLRGQLQGRVRTTPALALITLIALLP